MDSERVWSSPEHVYVCLQVRTLIVTVVSVVVYFGLFAGLAGSTHTGWNEVSAGWQSTTIVVVVTFIGGTRACFECACGCCASLSLYAPVYVYVFASNHLHKIPRSKIMAMRIARCF